MLTICAKNVVKKYQNGSKALNGLSLQVKQGEIFSLLGQNGAGKSTLIHILTTYLQPSSGDIWIFGEELSKKASNIRTRIACVGQKVSIDSHLSLKENMIFQSKIYRLSKEEAKERIETLITCFRLEPYLKYPIASYSEGIKRKLDIALSMIPKPDLLFLDEPTVGMDVQTRKIMWDMVRKIHTDFGTTIFLTTHYLEEAEALSDTICIIKEGKEVIQGTVNSLRKYLKQNIIHIKFKEKKTAKVYFKLFADTFTDRKIEQKENALIFYTKNENKDFKDINRRLLEQEIPFIGIEIIQPTLEDIFLQFTRERGE